MHKLPDKLTIGEAFGPAMEMTDPFDARIYFEALVERQMRIFGHDRAKAERDTKANLGYYAGYYSNGTRERVERLFNCAHPIFGAISERGAPSPEEALRKGLDMAEAANKKARQRDVSEARVQGRRSEGGSVTKGDQLLAEAEAGRAARACDMPTEQDAIDAMYRAYSRLRELGWRDGIYMPKDGTVVTVMQIGSTGTFDCRYSGKWADGFFNIMDGGDVYPTRSVPPLFKLKG